eukprot:1038119-Prymnesium_polylepis.1
MARGCDTAERAAPTKARSPAISSLRYDMMAGDSLNPVSYNVAFSRVRLATRSLRPGTIVLVPSFTCFTASFAAHVSDRKS